MACKKCNGSGHIPIIGTFTVPCGCGDASRLSLLSQLGQVTSPREACATLDAWDLGHMLWAKESLIFGPDPQTCYMAVQILPNLDWVPWMGREVLRSEAGKQQLLDWMLEYSALSLADQAKSIQRYKQKFC